MNPIRSAENIPFGNDLRYCYRHGIMFQTDMTQSIEYGEKYYQHYVNLIETEISNKLNSGRVTITEKYSTCLLDVGIGSGEFIMRSKMKTYGFDINPYGVRWLEERGLFVDKLIPDEIDGWTFWDTLEHIPEPQQMLGRVKSGNHVYVSLPIFHDITKIRQSKHYKPGEHYYYFTERGFIWFANELGFDIVEMSDIESLAGRENIQTFVLRKA